MMFRLPRLWLVGIAGGLLVGTTELRAQTHLDISLGLGNGAIDQPRVSMIIRDSNGDLLASSDTGLSDLFELLGLDPADFGFSPNAIDAYYDTGAGVGLIGGYTAGAYGVPLQPTAEFSDVGVGGVETFGVSDLLTIQIASYAPNLNPGDLSSYDHVFSGVRAAVGETPQNFDSQDPIDQALEQLIGSLYDFSVLGMPYFDNKVVVMDARSLNNFVSSDQQLLDDAIPALFTHLYDASENPGWNPSNVNNPGIPDASAIDATIALNFANFSSLTSTTGGIAPTLAHNPMIGPLPAHLDEDPNDGRGDLGGITITRGTGENRVESEGTWLLDTGAAATIISLEQAAALGVTYSLEPGKEFNSADPTLVGVSEEEQFILQLGGVGGTVTVAGFYLDELIVPTADGGQVILRNAPVLVADISIDDPSSPGGKFTLDGIFGMNLLLATAFLDGPIDLFGVGDLLLYEGAFDFIVYDETNNLLHLVVPEPHVLGTLLLGASLFAVRRRRAA